MMRIVIENFNVLRGAELKGFAEVVMRVANSGGGLQFFWQENPSHKEHTEVVIKTTEESGEDSSR